jgi:hypothetical protein
VLGTKARSLAFQFIQRPFGWQQPREDLRWSSLSRRVLGNSLGRTGAISFRAYTPRLWCAFSVAPEVLEHHVAMDLGEGHSGTLTDALNQAIDGVRGERSAALSGEDEARIRELVPQLAQRPQFVTERSR